MAKGLFITFEGGEGSGKTSACEKVAEYLQKKGHEVLRVHEPGGTKIGEEIKKLLLEDRGYELNEKAELFLFLASRAQLVEEVIRPALNSGKTVLCDRFVDSTVAYQAYGRGIDEKLVKQLNRVAAGNLDPDLTIVLDVETPIGLKRARSRGQNNAPDRIEKAKLGFHERVRQGYFALVRAEPSRIKMVNGEGDMKKTERAVKRHVDLLLTKISQAEDKQTETAKIKKTGTKKSSSKSS